MVDANNMAQVKYRAEVVLDAVVQIESAARRGDSQSAMEATAACLSAQRQLNRLEDMLWPEARRATDQMWRRTTNIEAMLEEKHFGQVVRSCGQLREIIRAKLLTPASKSVGRKGAVIDQVRLGSGFLTALDELRTSPNLRLTPLDDSVTHSLRHLVDQSAYVVRELIWYVNMAEPGSYKHRVLKDCLNDAKEMSRITRAALGWKVRPTGGTLTGVSWLASRILIAMTKTVGVPGYRSARKAVGDWRDNPNLRPDVKRAKYALETAAESYRSGNYTLGWKAFNAARIRFRKLRSEFQALGLRSDAARITQIVGMIDALYQDNSSANTNTMLMQRGPEQTKWMYQQLTAIISRMPPGDDL